MVSSKLIEHRDLDVPTDIEVDRLLKVAFEQAVDQWKTKTVKLLNILNSIESCRSRTNLIHVNDLELVLNGLGYFPTSDQLEEISFELRFRDSHLTWDVHQDIDIDGFCQLIENHAKWMHVDKSE